MELASLTMKTEPKTNTRDLLDSFRQHLTSKQVPELVLVSRRGITRIVAQYTPRALPAYSINVGFIFSNGDLYAADRLDSEARGPFIGKITDPGAGELLAKSHNLF